MSDCNLCNKCHYTKDKDPNARPANFPPVDPQSHLKIIPDKAVVTAKAAKPNCSECWGCSTQIQPLVDVMAFGHKFTVEKGASPEWLFHAGVMTAACPGTLYHAASMTLTALMKCADLPDTHITGKRAIVKVWCMPVDKVGVRLSTNPFMQGACKHSPQWTHCTHTCCSHLDIPSLLPR